MASINYITEEPIIPYTEDSSLQTSLYNYYAKVTIASHEFDCPPFAIDFEQRYSENVTPVHQLKIYNPSKTTVSNCIKNSYIRIDAGYKPYISNLITNSSINFGTVINGKIDYSKTSKVNYYESKANLILELSVLNIKQEYFRKALKYSFNNLPVSVILSNIMQECGFIVPMSNIQLGEDILLKSFVPTYFEDSLNKLCKLSKSRWFLDNEDIRIVPEINYSSASKIINISPKSGLIETVKKSYDKQIILRNPGKDLVVFKTLFFPTLKLHSNVMITNGSGDKKQYRIVGGIKRFSTYKPSISEWEAVSV
jgi:hypothetical protein